jgi:hypothetical protein
MYAMVELIEDVLYVLRDESHNLLLSIKIDCNAVNRSTHKVWVSTHYMITIELPQALILKFRTHTLPTSQRYAGILSVVSPEIVNVTSLLPRVELIFVERVRSILRSEEAKIVWQLRIECVVLEHGIV